MFYVYILYSPKIKKFYAGQTDDLEKRLLDHNRGASRFTTKGVPWILVTSFSNTCRSEAIKLESKIKSRGIKRFLQDINYMFPDSIPNFQNR
jgi:putative endonuclease